MILWLQSWAWTYDLSFVNALVCIFAAFASVWVTQCMVRVPRSPWWAFSSIMLHRLMLLLLAAMLMLEGVSPYLDFGDKPTVGDVLMRAAILVMLLIWPASSRARRRFGPHA